MSTSVSIEGQDGRGVIRAVAYERPVATDSADANWLTSAIEISTGNFSGVVDGALTTEDVDQFRQDLAKALEAGNGIAEFRTLEQILELKIILNARGHATVFGALHSLDRPATVLSFSFETDQSFLRRTASDVDGIVEAFPIRLA